MNYLIREWIKTNIEEEFKSNKYLTLSGLYWEGKETDFKLSISRGGYPIYSESVTAKTTKKNYSFDIDLTLPDKSVESLVTTDKLALTIYINTIDRQKSKFEEAVQLIEEYDFHKSIKEIAAKHEILFNFHNPISYIDLYQNMFDIESNVELVPAGIEDDDIRKTLTAYYIASSLGDKKIQLKDFPKDNEFVKFLNVKKVIKTISSSSKYSINHNRTTYYCLYFRGIRISDMYVDSILPKEKSRIETISTSDGPGSSPKTTFRYSTSYVETEKFHNIYNLDHHCRFLEPLFQSHTEFNKTVEKQQVYHELGHIFGFTVSKALGYEFGEIAEINLVNSGNNPYILLKNSPIKFTKTSDPNKRLIELNAIKLFLNEDRKRVLAYFIYLLSGAIFNIHCFTKNPKYEDFESVFLDDNQKIELGWFTARAGNDFTKIMNYKFELSWGHYDFQRFKYMAYELFYIYDKHFIFFDCLGSDSQIRNDFNRIFNGHQTKSPSEISQIESMVKRVIQRNGFLSSINILIDKYDNNIEHYTNDLEKVD